MTLTEAKKLAQRWIAEEALNLPGFYGAFFHGSANWLHDDEELDPSSDLDIMVVFDQPPTIKLGKIIYNGLMLEVSYMATQDLQSIEEILSTSYLAGSFHVPSVIADPTGNLAKLQQGVAIGYAKRKWVTKRAEYVEQKIVGNLQGLSETLPHHTNVTNWLFSTGLTTHILLVAGLKNPTVRKRYAASRALLEEHNLLSFQETLLEMLGCANMTPRQVQKHLDALATVFDATTEVIQTPIFFATDLSKLARPIAIDGSQALIDSGLHREAIFWIVATYARCQHVLHVDGTEEIRNQHLPGFHDLLADLGIHSFTDMSTRAENVKASLSDIWSIANMIMENTPEIRD